VVAALIAMGVYMKRGAEGRLRDSTDQIGEQYDALNTTSNYITTIKMNQTESTDNSGVQTTTIRYNTQNKTGSETVGDWLGNPDTGK
jgi:hypothetical protein